MTALTDTRDTLRKPGEIISFDMGVDIVYKGALVMVSAAGYAIAGDDTADCFFVGLSLKEVDNSSGSAGDTSVRVNREGTYVYACTGMTQANVGDTVYIVDDQTVGLAATTTNDVQCGTIVEVISATSERIDIKNSVK